ncbi:hypothetical protein GGS24DRAFT_508031 [Hypoxylon argillaceum]|nr:hypothetical protein GGS24DRAFT_508031 [Hypoxylon argillaceum]
MEASRQHRRRLPRSCEECRRRKVKCDRNHPCSHCVMTKGRCLYSSPHISARHRRQSSQDAYYPDHRLPSQRAVDPNANLRPSLHQRLGPIPSSQVPAPAEEEGSGRAVGRLLSNASGSFQPRSAETTQLVSGAQYPELLSTQDEEFSNSEIGPSSASLISSSAKQGSDVTLDPLLVLNKSRLFGRTHWTNAVYEFKKISTFMRSEATNSAEQTVASPPKVNMRTLLQQCKRLSQNAKIIRPGRFLVCPEPIVSSSSMADHFVHLYQLNIESSFRILHLPSFRKDYEAYKAAPANIPDVAILKIQLVIAIGSGLYTELAGDKDVHRAACQWLYAAQDWLSGPIEKDRLKLDSLQVHCLLILACQILSVGGDLAWVAMGTLLRTALQLGLHRDPKHFSKITVFQAEIRKRLWATILELNAQASLDSGTMPGISYDDFDTGPPANVNDEDMDETTVLLKQHSETAETDTTLQRLLLQNLSPRLEMLRRMNGVGITLNDEKILELSSKLSAACREVNAQNGAHHGIEIAGFRQNMASLLLRRFLLVLHRPLAGRIRENALYYHSRKMSFDSAMALLKPPSSNDAFSYLMLRGGGLFKSCLNHVSLALASELLIEIEEKGPDTYRQMLVDAVREARERWVQRLKLGGTNVMLHMKLSIVLSHVEQGGDEGTPTQQHMAQSAKDSLETCYSLMKEKISSDLTGTAPENGGWSSERLLPARSNEQLDLPNSSLSLGEMLEMDVLDMNGIFDTDIMCL